MRTALLCLAALSLTCTTYVARQAAPRAEVRVVPVAGENVVSIRAESIPLGQLLRQLDAATGMTSRVATKDLENRKISVRFSNLDYASAIRKIFQGQALDYIFIREQGIIVTAASQTGSGSPQTATPVAAAAPIAEPPPLPSPAAPAAPAATSNPPSENLPERQAVTDSTPRVAPRNAPLAMPGGGPPGEDTPVLPFSASTPAAAPATPMLTPTRPIEASSLQSTDTVEAESSIKKARQER